MNVLPPTELFASKDTLSMLVRPRLKRRATSGYVLTWTTIAGRKSVVRCLFLDADLGPVGCDLSIPVASAWARVDAGPLADGSVVLAWSDGDRVLARRANLDGFAGPVISLARSDAQVPQLEVQVFSTDVVAISWQHALVIIPGDGVPMLSATSPNAWHATIALAAPDLLVRIHSSRVMGGAEPIYSIIGSYYGTDARSRGTFSYRLPSRIVDDTYAHPEHPVVIAGGDSLWVAWTDLAHRRGNSIQAVELCAGGDPVGSQVVIVAAATDEHVGFPSLVRTASDELVMAWSHTNEMCGSLRGQRYSDDIKSIGEPFTLAMESDEGGTLLADGDGGVLAVWSAAGRIFSSRLELGAT